MNKSKDLSTKQWRIYDYLKSNSIGKDNATSGDFLIQELIRMYPYDFKGYKKNTLQKDIRALKLSPKITRRIGSSPKGYWLEMAGDNGIEFLKKLAVSHILTAISQGVSTSYFHQVLNEVDPNYIHNGQMRITFTKHQNDTVHTLSDDLKK